MTGRRETVVVGAGVVVLVVDVTVVDVDVDVDVVVDDVVVDVVAMVVLVTVVALCRSTASSLAAPEQPASRQARRTALPRRPAIH